MRVEFTDNTAVWEWSDAWWSNGKQTFRLVKGDQVAVKEDGGLTKTVTRIVGDSDFQGWVARDKKDEYGPHPRGGIVYKSNT